MDRSCIDGNLTEERIRELLASPVDLPQPESYPHPGLRPASVLVPMFCLDGEWHLLLTHRTETVNDHKGQVSFPGGASEPEDASPEMTALREAQEEIGLQPKDVTILGRLPSQPTISRFLIVPVVGRIPYGYPFRLSSAEVERVFSIPLSWLATPTHFEERLYRSMDGNEHPVIFFQGYDGETLWGISARITLLLLKTLKLLK